MASGNDLDRVVSSEHILRQLDTVNPDIKNTAATKFFLSICEKMEFYINTESCKLRISTCIWQ